MPIRKKKISELPLADSLKGLYTIGYKIIDGIKTSVKVSLEDIQTAYQDVVNAVRNSEEATKSANTAVDNATIATEAANQAAIEANKSAENAEGKAQDAQTAANTANEKAELAEQAAFDAYVAIEEAEAATQSANNAASNAEEKAAAANTAAQDAERVANNPTYIGKDHYVYVYNKETESFDKTDIYCKGEQGRKGDKGEPGDGAGNILVDVSNVEAGKKYLYVPASDGSANGTFEEFNLADFIPQGYQLLLVKQNNNDIQP